MCYFEKNISVTIRLFLGRGSSDIEIFGFADKTVKEKCATFAVSKIGAQVVVRYGRESLDIVAPSEIEIIFAMGYLYGRQS